MSNINIPILMYHSIESMPKSTIMRSLHVPPRRFKFQMWLLKILGYRGLSLKELKPYLDGYKHGKVVGITFDDGYKDHIDYVLPELKKRGLQGSFFPPAIPIIKGSLLDVNAIHFILDGMPDEKILISSLKENPLYLAIIGTKDNGVIPGWVFISRTNNFLPNDFFSSNLKSVLVTPLHFKNL